MSRLPGRYRRRLLVRPGGAGFSHQLLEHIAAGGGVQGRSWEFSVGWSCTDKEMDAIARLSTGAWTAGIDQNGDLIDDTFVAEVTGLLDLSSWQRQIPRSAGHRPRRATAPPLPQAGHRAGAPARAPLPADRHQHPHRADRLARRAAPLPRPRENDNPIWPHCDGLIWPHLGSCGDGC